jgi:hypothetical protein
MSGPSNIKIQKTGAEDIGNGHGGCPLLILSVRGMETKHIALYTTVRRMQSE